MALQLAWEDFWSLYIDSPERLQSEVDAMPDILKGKSAKVQIEIIRGAPSDVIDRLMPCLSNDAQLYLLQRG